MEFKRAAKRGAKLCRLEQPERRLAVAFEKLRDSQTGSIFNAVVQIDETPGKLAGKLSAEGRLAGTHKTGESDYGSCWGTSHAKSLDEKTAVTQSARTGLNGLSNKNVKQKK